MGVAPSPAPLALRGLLGVDETIGESLVAWVVKVAVIPSTEEGAVSPAPAPVPADEDEEMAPISREMGILGGTAMVNPLFEGGTKRRCSSGAGAVT